jgi:hypothetical protein
MLEKLKDKGFQVVALHHAEAIISQDMPQSVTDLETVLGKISLPIEEIIRGGGGEGKLTQRIRNALAELGWKKHNFEIKKTVDGVAKEYLCHEIDHVKAFGGWTFALEIEWNNKDPFFDRDLENFKRLHVDGVISVGAIITRGNSLQNSMREFVTRFSRNAGFSGIENLRDYYNPTARQVKMIERAIATAGDFHTGWANAFVADKFGEATTHWRKLEDRVRRGVGNPCPLLLIGIPADIVTF